MDHGVKNLDVAEAGQLAGADPDYSIKDVFEAVSCSLGYEGVWLMHSQAYSYHCISITAACSMGATEVICVLLFNAHY